MSQQESFTQRPYTAPAANSNYRIASDFKYTNIESNRKRFGSAQKSTSNKKARTGLTMAMQHHGSPSGSMQALLPMFQSHSPSIHDQSPNSALLDRMSFASATSLRTPATDQSPRHLFRSNSDVGLNLNTGSLSYSLVNSPQSENCGDFYFSNPSLYQSQLVSSSSSPLIGTGSYNNNTLEIARPHTASSLTGDQTFHDQQITRKKRNKCNPEQFRQLEAFFARNRNPTGKVREELAKRIQMPERSVQVWFQNKRAKTKLHDIKHGNGNYSENLSKSGSQISEEDYKGSPEQSRHTISPRRRNPTAQQTRQEEPVIQFPVTSLCIGTWRRIKPLICLFSRRNQTFTWYLSSESVGFKLECPLSIVRQVLFVGPREPSIFDMNEGINAQIGHLVIQLDRPPQFYMEVFRSSGLKDGEDETGARRASWRQCSDFTEGKQATSIFSHIVSGTYIALRQAAMELKQSGGAISSLCEIRDGIEFDSNSTHLQTFEGQKLDFGVSMSAPETTSQFQMINESDAWARAPNRAHDREHSAPEALGVQNSDTNTISSIPDSRLESANLSVNMQHPALSSATTMPDASTAQFSAFDSAFWSQSSSSAGASGGLDRNQWKLVEPYSSTTYAFNSFGGQQGANDNDVDLFPSTSDHLGTTEKTDDSVDTIRKHQF